MGVPLKRQAYQPVYVHKPGGKRKRKTKHTPEEVAQTYLLHAQQKHPNKLGKTAEEDEEDGKDDEEDESNEEEDVEDNEEDEEEDENDEEVVVVVVVVLVRGIRNRK